MLARMVVLGGAVEVGDVVEVVARLVEDVVVDEVAACGADEEALREVERVLGTAG